MSTSSLDRANRTVRRAGRVRRVGACLRVLLAMLPLAAGACDRPDAIEHELDGAEPRAGEAAGPTRHVFDPATVQTLAGTVLAVQPFQRMQGTRYGVRARLDVEGEVVYVYLGPQGYLASRGLSLAPGDEIEVSGSMLGEEGRQVVIATEVVEGGRTVALRDADGRPRWRGWRGGKADAQ